MSTTDQVGTKKLLVSLTDIQKEVMPQAQTMWPKSFQYEQAPNTEGWDKRCALWQRQFAKAGLCCDDIMNALEYINANDDKDTIPTIAKIITQGQLEKKNRLSKDKTTGRRIVTPEEDCANEYIQIMQSVVDGKAKKTQELVDYLQKLKPYYLLFYGDGWEERHEKHFGKRREDFERL